jgi:2-polyprenyl-3-methyl-5-hydroxy-6-metoxy-1,4-benzoquinol methylase
MKPHKKKGQNRNNYKMNLITCPLCKFDKYIIVHKHNKDIYWKNTTVQNVICKRCGLVYLNPQPNEKSMRKFYIQDCRNVINQPYPTKEYLQTIKLRTDTQINWLGPLIGLNNKTNSKNKNKNILDIGSAAGVFLNYFKEAGYNCHGVEPTTTFAKFSQKEFGHKISNSTLQEAKFIQKFDIITISHVLEHVYNLSGFLKEVNKLLKKDGLLFIEVPNVHRRKFVNKTFFHVQHLYNFSKITLSMLLFMSGFKVLNTWDHKNLRILAKKTSIKTTKPFSSTFFTENGENWKDIYKDIKSPIKQIKIYIKNPLNKIFSPIMHFFRLTLEKIVGKKITKSLRNFWRRKVCTSP